MITPTVSVGCNNLSLQWRHNGRDSVSNHKPHDCVLNRLFRCRPKKTSKLRVTGLCAGNSPVTGEFPAQMASNAENVSIWWRHHACPWYILLKMWCISLDKSLIAKYGNGYDCTAFTLLFLSTDTSHFLKNHFDVTCLILYVLLGSNDIFSHDDDIKWRHFPRYWTFVRRIHPSPVDSPHKPPATGGFPSQRPVTRGFDVFFDKSYTSDVKRRNTLSCLDQHRHRGLKLWNSRDCEAV